MSTTKLGILVTGIGTGKLSERVSASIANRASVAGFSLLWNTTDHSNGDESEKTPIPSEMRIRRICEQLVRQKVAGVFFEPLELESNAQEVNEMVLSVLKHAGIPVVLLDSDVANFPERSPYDLVGMDNMHIGFITTQHLLSQSHTRVDYFFKPGSASTVGLRVKGYQLALVNAGITPSAEYVHKGDPGDVSFVRSCVDKGMRNVVCANDVTAASLMHTLYELGHSVPKTFRITGVDDVDYARLLKVPLTTYSQPSEAIGATAVEIMLSRLKNPELEPRTVSMTGTLIIRQSA